MTKSDPKANYVKAIRGVLVQKHKLRDWIPMRIGVGKDSEGKKIDYLIEIQVEDKEDHFDAFQVRLTGPFVEEALLKTPEQWWEELESATKADKAYWIKRGNDLYAKIEEGKKDPNAPISTDNPAILKDIAPYHLVRALTDTISGKNLDHRSISAGKIYGFHAKDVLDGRSDKAFVSPRDVIKGKIQSNESKSETTKKASKSKGSPSMEKELKTLLEKSKAPQVILTGPPGTGKTRLARRVAYWLVNDEEPDEGEEFEKIFKEWLESKEGQDRCQLVVFHPAYEYDQFIGGLSVTSSEKGEIHYKPKDGNFLKLCKMANQADASQKFVLIIDEINRGNLPRLLGELIFALEYRTEQVTLSFEGQQLTVPKNLYIIGTMNTADRSVGTIDAAVRRRFAFMTVPPNPEVVRKWWEKKGENKAPQIVKLMDSLNQAIGESEELNDIKVGHSYFLQEDFDALEHAWKYRIQPLLREYRLMAESEKLKDYCGSTTTLDDVLK